MVTIYDIAKKAGCASSTVSKALNDSTQVSKKRKEEILAIAKEMGYGAFPTDAYSHTPGFAGVQQPGMTGQVKEDILSRFGELGVTITDGEICFNPRLLSLDEMLTQPTEWALPTGKVALDERQLGFTICSVPIIYELKNYQSITICYRNGDIYTFESMNKLNKEISQSIFNREGKIEKIVVRVMQTL